MTQLSEQDFYWENGCMVLTAHYLKSRGYCCHQGCRHCPYPVDAGASLPLENGHELYRDESRTTKRA